MDEELRRQPVAPPRPQDGPAHRAVHPRCPHLPHRPRAQLSLAHLRPEWDGAGGRGAPGGASAITGGNPEGEETAFGACQTTGHLRTEQEEARPRHPDKVFKGPQRPLPRFMGWGGMGWPPIH